MSMGAPEHTDFSTTPHNGPRCARCNAPTVCIDISHGGQMLCPKCKGKELPDPPQAKPIPELPKYPVPDPKRDRGLLERLDLRCDECGHVFRPFERTTLILIPARGDEPSRLYCERCAAIES